MSYKRVASYWCTCAVCGHEWLAVVIPSRCASRKKCRAWGAVEEGGEVLPAVSAVERQPARKPAVEAKPRKTTVASLLENEYLTLKPSEALRLKRERDWKAEHPNG